MTPAGRIFDIYDDYEGSVLRSLYPRELPELLKSASYTPKEAAEKLPSSLFALHMLDGRGHTTRKYACATPIDTVLSVEYFLHQRDLLSDDLQKVAAQNLQIALGWYSLRDNPLLTKVAGIGSVVANGFTGLAKRVGAGIAKDPMGSAFKAMGAVGTASAIGGAAKDSANAVRNVAQAERAAGGFGRIV